LWIENPDEEKMVQKKALPFKIPKTTAASLILQVDKEPYFYDKLHQHEEFQLTVIISGTGSLVHGEYVGPFEMGDVFLMGSNVPHVFRCDESYYKEDKTAHSISIFFNADQINVLLMNFPELSEVGSFMNKAILGGKAAGTLRLEVGGRVESFFKMNEFDRLLEFLRLLNELAQNTLWQPLLEQVGRSVKEQDGKRLDDIFSYTLSNYQRTISIDEIAEVANMNKSSFCRYFKQHTRKSYIDFLNEYRIQKACGLLADPDKSIANVAFEVGFTNLSNFNRQFKRLKNFKPREFRNKVLSNYS